MLVLVVLLLLALAIGFILGFAVRESISRRRRVAAEERYWEEKPVGRLPHLE